MGGVFVAICIVDSCCHDQVQQHHWFPISHTMVAQVGIDRARAIVAKCIRAISDAEVVLCECKADKARAEAVLGELVAVQAQERVRVRLGLDRVVPAPRMASGGDVVVVIAEPKPTPKRSREPTSVRPRSAFASWSRLSMKFAQSTVGSQLDSRARCVTASIMGKASPAFIGSTTRRFVSRSGPTPRPDNL